MTLGPSLGGLLVQVLGAPFAIVFDSASYLFSAVMLRGLRTAREVVAPSTAARNLRSEIAEGLVIVVRQPGAAIARRVHGYA